MRLGPWRLASAAVLVGLAGLVIVLLLGGLGAGPRPSSDETFEPSVDEANPGPTSASTIDRPDSADPLGTSAGWTYAANLSSARNWNEALLDAIRGDLARPTVHARNLFHASAGMYDIWSVWNKPASPVFLANTTAGSLCPFATADRDALLAHPDTEAAQDEAISYFMYKLLHHRFAASPSADSTLAMFNRLMVDMGYNTDEKSAYPPNGNPAALGNHLADCLIAFGLQDGSNEQYDYANQNYEPINDPLQPFANESVALSEPDHWQPLQLGQFIDQAGFETEATTFIGAEWGEVVPFSLTLDQRTTQARADVGYTVYVDPGPPPSIDEETQGYEWGHSLVAAWSSHLDPSDGVMWDISPGASGGFVLPLDPDPAGAPGADRGEILDLFRSIYQPNGGDGSIGHPVNPATGEPYDDNIVPRGDYTRVLAEFWADGPESETPPGHWFTILNEKVSDHPSVTKTIAGTGPEVDDLEWDVKSYLALGGAMHDSAISAWSIKGWYDYVRPISAIRHMASLGQNSDPALPNYNPNGIPLRPGVIELITEDDEPVLTGPDGDWVGTVKIHGWQADKVQWHRAAKWMPYQRPNFVTPPFAGYVSGHSTFSRAAAEVLTELTGDEYFPGGMAEFVAERNNFLEFDQGPSVDVRLQWATYRDASDQTSLSRIWGGIHPPADDIPGRQIGEQVGQQAFAHAQRYWSGTPVVSDATVDERRSPGPGKANDNSPSAVARLTRGSSIVLSIVGIAVLVTGIILGLAKIVQRMRET